MIDLHSHVLPGVDDGARDLAEAIAMCTLAAEDGCQAIVATPHQRHAAWSNTDTRRLVELRDTLQAAVGTRIEILLGAEIHVDNDLLTVVDTIDLEQPTAAPVLSLAGQRSLLLELDRMPPLPSNRAPLAFLHELLIAGWLPILAHPELIPWLVAEPPVVHDLVERGVWLQVTAMSLTGEFGRGPEQRAWALVDAGLVHVVASDCHTPQRRPPGLSAARRLLADRYGEGVAHALTFQNPARALSLLTSTNHQTPSVLAAGMAGSARALAS